MNVEAIRQKLQALTDDELRAAVSRDLLAQRHASDDALLRTWLDQAWIECGRRHRPDLYGAGLKDAKDELRQQGRAAAAAREELLSRISDKV